MFAVLAVMTLLAAACGSESTTDADGAQGPELEESAQLVAEGHGDGGPDGHELALGDTTPTVETGHHILHHADTGPDVTELQTRLGDLGAPVGEPDGIFGDRTLAFVIQFQESEGITADGVVGPATWAALDSPTAPVDWQEPVLPEEYSTEAPNDKPGAPVDATAQKGDAVAAGQPSAPANDPAAGKWARAEVNLTTETATFYDGAGNVVLNAPISSGKNGLTPAGTFHVQSKSERAWAGSNGVYMNHMTRFNGGIGFHSIPKRADGSDIPTPLGQQAVSHGCIRMQDDQAQLVFNNLPIGATVEVHR